MLAQLVPLMAGAKTPMLREQLIKAVDLVGKSMHPSRLPKPLLLRQRDELLRHLLTFLKEGVQQPPLRVLGVNAVATLMCVIMFLSVSLGFKRIDTDRVRLACWWNGLTSNLDPPLAPELRTAVLDEVLPYLELDEAKVGEEVAELTVQNLHAVLSSMVHMDAALPLLSALLQVSEFHFSQHQEDFIILMDLCFG